MSDATAPRRAAQILLVEDNEDDVYFTRRAFEAGSVAVNIHHVNNGEKCMAFLRRQSPYGEAPAPDLVLLDLNMPIMDGHDVLAAIVADDSLRHLPVIVLTTSSEAVDVQKMYRLRCNAYIAKPVDFDRFAEVVSKFLDFWFTVTVLPKNGL